MAEHTNRSGDNEDNGDNDSRVPDVHSGLRINNQVEQPSHVFETALNFIADPVYVLGRDGRFVYANKRLLDLLNITLEEIIGKNFHDLPFPPELSHRLQQQIEQVLVTIEDDGPGFDVEAALSLPPGKRRLGIFGMQERARLAGGELSVESEPGAGTTVFLRLPIPAVPGVPVEPKNPQSAA